MSDQGETARVLPTAAAGALQAAGLGLAAAQTGLEGALLHYYAPTCMAPPPADMVIDPDARELLESARDKVREAIGDINTAFRADGRLRAENAAVRELAGLRPVEKPTAKGEA